MYSSIKKALLPALMATVAAVSGSAQEATQLASWTFETGYEETDLGGGNFLYTPSETAEIKEITGWSNSNIPQIRPEACVGDAADYAVSAYNEGRYWQLTNGYQTRVLRITNDSFDNVDVTDYTDPAQHKVYYELTFPTKGYKGISIDFAVAPGNNTQTPMQAVVSTDNGNTWIAAGTYDTSDVWFSYTDRTIQLSANDKEKVILRLFPTTGKTNWNMRNISVTAAEQVGGLAQADNQDVSFAWPMGSITPQLTATTTASDLFSVYELAIGNGLTISKVGKVSGGSDQTLFKPSVNNGATPDENDALVMTVIPRKGITFKPTGFAFQASKHGTGGGKLAIEVRQGEKSVMIKEDINPERNNTGTFFSSFNEAITGFEASEAPVSVVLYIYSLSNSKEMGVADMTIYGVADGQVLAVPVYTFTLTSATPAAGTVSCAPAGSEFDEGTLLTVSTTENFGYHFKAWTDAEGKVVSEANPYKFEIMENTTLVATYEANNVYALNVALEGGANDNLVQFQPAGHVVDGIHYYEEGTDVCLTTLNNRILTFTNWEDNTTATERIVTMDSEKNLTATFSAADYIVGWDFYYDQPASERAADYKDETDNAGLLSLHNPEGKTTSWLTRGINNGAENGKWGARIWKLRSDENYFEVSFSTVGYSNIVCTAALGISYNSYSINNAQYSIDGENYNTVQTYNLAPGWVTEEFALPADAANQPRVWIRFMQDRESPLVGSETDYDGLAIAELFILADKDAANDDTAPSVVGVIPADGSEGASATGSIIVTFDEKIKAGTGDATLNGQPLKMTISGKNAVFAYRGLDYATTYTFSLPAGAVIDRSGNPCAAFSSKFTTLERVQPEARLFDAIVAADGSGDYLTPQEAIDAAPAGRIKPWLIFVKNGTYKGHVDIPASKTMLHFIGQDRDKTIIEDDRLCGGENAVSVSVGATVVVNSNDCFFENITLSNSYGHKQQTGPQALALNTGGDRTIFNNVAMLSYQDTWITPSTSNYRAYVRNSFIEGAVDFIYNSGNIYIENTTLYINRKSGGFIVAPSHATDVLWGYVFNNCTITAPGVPSETDVWLGRPWHNFPKTVFLNTRAEVTIPATGWYETMGGLPVIWADWNTFDANGNPIDLSQRRDTYYYTDSNGNKVYGTAKNHLTDEEAAEYTVSNVLSGNDNWEPIIKTEPCAAPAVTVDEAGTLTWDAVPYAICYLVTRGDEVVGFTTDLNMTVTPSSSNGAQSAAADFADYRVQAVNEFGGLSERATVKDTSSIIDTLTDLEGKVIGIYDLQGRALAAPAKGVNIVRILGADGTVTVTKTVVR